MKKWMTLTLGTCAIALALAALPSAVAETPVPTPVVPTPVIDGPLFSTVLDALPSSACERGGIAPPSLLPGAGYQCPDGVPYCFRAHQCVAYCAGGDPVCSFGCCACAS